MDAFMNSQWPIIILVVVVIVIGVGLVFMDQLQQLRPNRLRCYVTDNVRETKRYWKTTHEDLNQGKFVLIGPTKNPGKYAVDPNRIYHMGTFRVPTAFYKLGVFVPLNMLPDTADGSANLSAIDNHEATEKHVMKDVLDAFMPGLLTPTMSFILLFIAILGAAGILWKTVTDGDKKIMDRLPQPEEVQGTAEPLPSPVSGVQSPVATPTRVPVRPFPTP